MGRKEFRGIYNVTLMVFENPAVKIYYAKSKQNHLEKKEVVYKQSMVGTPTSYTQAQSLDERLVDNNISSTTQSIIAQNSKQTQNNSKIQDTNISKFKSQKRGRR